MSHKQLTLCNLEWNFSEEYTHEIINGIGTNKVFELIKKTDVLPLSISAIKFSDDTWALAPLTLTKVPQRKSTYKFDEISDYYKDKVKFFVLTLLWEDKIKLQSIYPLLGILKKFIKYLVKKNIYELQYVSLSTIEQYIDLQSKYTLNTIKKIKNTISKFFQFYCNNYTKFEWNDIYTYLNEIDTIAALAEREANKWPTIPADYYNRLLSCMVKTMHDPKIPIDERGIAAIMVILAQTGLRQGELRDCTVNALKTVSIFNNTKTAYYMDYYTTKNVKGNITKRLVHTSMTKLAQEAFLILENIYSERRSKLNSDLLFVPLKAKTLPVTENTLNRMLTVFLLKHSTEIDCINVSDRYPELGVQSLEPLIKRKATTQEVLSRFKPSDTLSYPRNHQFRVYLCNKLYEQGVPLLYIQQHMNHLSKEMTCYYFRSEKNLKQEQEYAESVMKMVVSGEVNLLGDTSDNLIQYINNFLESEHLNIEKDLDNIVKKLVKKMPVRAKNGGICIKSGPIRDCRKNDISDEIFCSYGMCPNNFHTFYMVNITYDKFKTLEKTIKYNQDNNFLKAVDKETNKLKWLITKYLIPELDELRKELNKHSVEFLQTKYPQIKWHISNIDIIYEEVNRWIQ